MGSTTVPPSATGRTAPPFYLYDSRTLPLFHDELAACLTIQGRHEVIDDQHTTGYWMHFQLKSHPARTPHANRAVLFVVPFWMTVSWKLGQCNGTTHLERVSLMLQALNTTPHFRRKAHRHVFPSSSFMIRTSKTMPAAPAGLAPCLRPWDNAPDFAYFPPEQAAVALLRKVIVAHMERLPRRPTLCASTIPGSDVPLFDSWPPPWWGARTLVLPYVVDAATTAAARAGTASHFDYRRWRTRRHSLSFVGCTARKNGAAFVRFGLSALGTWMRASVHCSGNAGSPPCKGLYPGRFEEWLEELRQWKRLHRHAQQQWEPSAASAMRGEHCAPPVANKDVLATMADSMFCLCPRGDSPSTSRVYFAISVGCIPVIVSNAWEGMATPFHGLMNFSDLALFMREEDAIARPEAAMIGLLGSLGIQVSEGHPRTLVLPDAHTGAAAPLEARLAALRRVQHAMLWQLPKNRLIADLTLQGAVRLLRLKLPAIDL